MKILFFALLALLLLSSCSSQNAGFGFKSSDCKEVYKECMAKCSAKGESRDKCSVACAKTESLCRAMKIKGCMQDCNAKYGKDTQESAVCKERCKGAN